MRAPNQTFAEAPRSHPSGGTLPLIFWSAAALITIAAHAAISGLGRYFLWDEAVFFSQSGGFGRADGPPLAMAPSREPGTHALIALLRLLGAELPGVRLGWAVISIGLVATAFAVLERRTGRLAAGLGYLVYSASWVVIGHTTMLYGFSVAIGAGMLALGLVIGAYGDQGLRSKWTALAIAAGLTLLMLMRPYDGWITALIVGGWLGLSLVQHRVSGAFAGIVVGTSVALWVSGQIARAAAFHGSLGAWWTALQEQVGGTSARGFDILETGKTLLGFESGSLPQPLGWGAWATSAALAFLLLVPMVWRAHDADWQVAVTGLLGFGGYLTFILVYPFQGQGDKYFTWVVPYLALVISGLWSGVDRRTAALRPGMSAWLVAASTVLVMGGATTATAFWEEISPRLDAGMRVALTMNVLAENGPCLGASRGSTPQFQVGSGCSFSLVGTGDRLVAWIDGTADNGVPRFVYWAGTPDELGIDGWNAVRSLEDRGFYLWFEE